MGLTRAERYERNKRTKVRALVIGCARLAHKDPPEDFIDLMTNHILAVLPAPIIRKFMRGDLGAPMFRVMKLTLPYFCGKHAH